MKVAEIRLDEGERCERCLWQIKRAERVAAVGEGRRRTAAKDIRRAPQQEFDLHFLDSATTHIDYRSHPYQMHPVINGFSHGLKIARQLSIFAPVYALVPPFRIPRLCKRKIRTPNGVRIFVYRLQKVRRPKSIDHPPRFFHHSSVSAFDSFTAFTNLGSSLTQSNHSHPESRVNKLYRKGGFCI